MGFVDISKHVKGHELTDKQRNEAKKKFLERKRELQAALRAVDRGLKALAKKPKRKRVA
jgi:hypothetical protein